MLNIVAPILHLILNFLEACALGDQVEAHIPKCVSLLEQCGLHGRLGGQDRQLGGLHGRDEAVQVPHGRISRGSRTRSRSRGTCRHRGWASTRSGWMG